MTFIFYIYVFLVKKMLCMIHIFKIIILFRIPVELMKTMHNKYTFFLSWIPRFFSKTSYFDPFGRNSYMLIFSNSSIKICGDRQTTRRPRCWSADEREQPSAWSAIRYTLIIITIGDWWLAEVNLQPAM